MDKKPTLLDKINNVIDKLGTIILINLTFLAACIPIITIGQAWCGLLSALRFRIRGDKWFDGFKHGFKTRFLRGTIAWCVVLVLAAWTFVDIWTYIAGGAQLTAIIASCVMFTLVTMISVSLIVLNVYIPTSVTDWLRNAVNMIFRGHIWLLLSAVAMWLPLLIATYWGDIFYLTFIIYVAVYYALAALIITIVLKDSLMVFLAEAREEGTLIAEEGRMADLYDEEAEEVEEEEEEEEEESAEE